MKEQIIEIAGWYGAVAILIAYALVSFSVLRSTDFVFQFLNVTGAIGVIAVSISKKAYQPAVLNIIWGIVAIVAIVRMMYR